MDADARSDEELLAATARDAETFGVFYRRHATAVLRYMLIRTRRPELAAELTAEVFAAAPGSSTSRRLGAPEAAGRAPGYNSDMTISRAVPNIRSDQPAATRDCFVGLGFEVVMDLGWIITMASPTNSSAQVNIIGNEDMSAPGISVGVADVDAVHATIEERGLEIAYPLRDEDWGVRRFMLREPSGTIVNIVSHQ